jgi:hypothetical protein
MVDAFVGPDASYSLGEPVAGRDRARQLGGGSVRDHDLLVRLESYDPWVTAHLLAIHEDVQMCMDVNRFRHDGSGWQAERGETLLR